MWCVFWHRGCNRRLTRRDPSSPCGFMGHAAKTRCPPKQATGRCLATVRSSCGKVLLRWQEMPMLRRGIWVTKYGPLRTLVTVILANSAVISWITRITGTWSWQVSGSCSVCWKILNHALMAKVCWLLAATLTTQSAGRTAGMVGLDARDNRRVPAEAFAHFNRRRASPVHSIPCWFLAST